MLIWKNETNPEKIILPLTPTPTTTVANRDERSHIFQKTTLLLLLASRLLLLLRLRKLFKHQLRLLFTFRKPPSNSYQTYSVCFTSRSKADITYQMYVFKVHCGTPTPWSSLPAENLWSAKTPERIGPGTPWKHPWIYEETRVRMRMTYLYIWKNVPSHLKFLRKIHICAFIVLIFWQNSEKIQNHVLRIPFSTSDSVFALRRPPEESETGSFQKRRIGPFWEGN